METQTTPATNEQTLSVPVERLVGLGRYTLCLGTQREVVEVSDRLMDQWPSQRTSRVAAFLSGPPRFPIPVVELISWGCEFQPL